MTQTVLVGHYKPIEEATATATEAEGVRKRTLVVLPLDNKEIREIEVNVLKDATEEDYEKIFLVRNVSNTDELIDGSLYVDFVCSTSGMKFIQHKGTFHDIVQRKNPVITLLANITFACIFAGRQSYNFTNS